MLYKFLTTRCFKDYIAILTILWRHNSFLLKKSKYGSFNVSILTPHSGMHKKIRIKDRYLETWLKTEWTQRSDRLTKPLIAALATVKGTIPHVGMKSLYRLESNPNLKRPTQKPIKTIGTNGEVFNHKKANCKVWEKNLISDLVSD